MGTTRSSFSRVNDKFSAAMYFFAAMVFEFRAHRPSAYFRFGLLLCLLVAINMLLIAWLYPHLRAFLEAARQSIVFVVPGVVVLLLPSVVAGIATYELFVHTYRFTLRDDGMLIEQLDKQGKAVNQKVRRWDALLQLRLVDFEDNHYCNLEFSDAASNIVLHRGSGSFEAFYAAVTDRQVMSGVNAGEGSMTS